MINSIGHTDSCSRFFVQNRFLQYYYFLGMWNYHANTPPLYQMHNLFALFVNFIDKACSDRQLCGVARDMRISTLVCACVRPPARTTRRAVSPEKLSSGTWPSSQLHHTDAPMPCLWANDSTLILIWFLGDASCTDAWRFISHVTFHFVFFCVWSISSVYPSSSGSLKYWSFIRVFSVVYSVWTRCVLL